MTGEITMYGSGTIPSGWLECNGDSLLVANYQNLFNVIGYTFGGSGASFSLPDMRSRSPMGAGGGPGLSVYTLGTASGAETETLIGSITVQSGTGASPKSVNTSISHIHPILPLVFIIKT